MLKTIITVLLFGITLHSHSQTSLLHDSIKVDNSTILIATSSDPNNKVFEFCISKPRDIKKELASLTYGEVQEAPFEKNPIVIKLVSKGLITQTWIVKSKAAVIEIENKKYKFNAAELKRLATIYPIEYSVEKKDFEDKAQLTSTYENLLKDKSFLYIVPPDFDNQWQGKFVLTFTKNDTLNAPLALSTYLQPMFEKIENKDKFSIMYQPFDVGKNDGSTKFSMTVYGTKKLYQQFSDSMAIKKEWQPQPYTAYIIHRK